MPNSSELVDIGRVVSRPRSGRAGTYRRRRLIALGLIVLLQSSASLGEEEDFSEYELKAAFLLRLPSFVRWPSAKRPSAKIRICIVGPDPFGKTLDYLAKESRGGSAVTLARLEPAGDTSSCSVLFLGRMERASSASVLESVAGRAILTVSDTDEFARTGGMVRFVTQGKSVGFEINQTAVRASDIKLSSQLLTIASVVHHPLPWESGK